MAKPSDRRVGLRRLTLAALALGAAACTDARSASPPPVDRGVRPAAVWLAEPSWTERAERAGVSAADTWLGD